MHTAGAAALSGDVPVGATPTRDATGTLHDDFSGERTMTDTTTTKPNEPTLPGTRVYVEPRDPRTTVVTKSIGLMTDDERTAYQAEHTAAMTAAIEHPHPTTET